jgi:hypothetical protein
MPKQIRRSRRFWTPLVEKFEESGGAEGHREFAARHNVECGSFQRWLYRLRAEKRGGQVRNRGAKHSDTVKATAWPLVEVQGVPIGDSRFEIELPGERRLRVPAAFDAEALGRLLKVLSEVVS